MEMFGNHHCVYFDSPACVLTTICGKFELKVVFDNL